MNTNYLISDYAKSNLELDGIYRSSVTPGSKVMGGATMKGVCGFVFPISGKAKFTIQGVEYLLEKGTILHAGPKMELSKEVVGDENWEFILLHYKVLNEDCREESFLQMKYIFKIFSDRHRELMMLLEQLLLFQKEPSMNNALRSKALLYELIAKIFDFSRERTDSQLKDPMEEVLNYIHGNLDKNIIITEVAEKYGMDGKQFYYLFQKKIGISPKRYITSARLKRAKELLMEDEASISSISNMVGYDDALHFSRIFKRNIGISPSEFRNQFRKKSI
jgi:AraC family transcriptional regulator, arabinose operon regulatory protein